LQLTVLLGESLVKVWHFCFVILFEGSRLLCDDIVNFVHEIVSALT
jgi:hypothetical protein